jgi:hypothetical protein
MSQVKISQLPVITAINANTANTLFVGVDVPTGATGQFTAHVLAQGLYSNEILNVGANQQNLPNTVAQFSSNGESYIQTNLVNTNDGGSADIVVTANTGSGGSDSTNFIDMGWANKNYQPGSEYNNIGTAVQPNDGYLYAQGTAGQVYGNLIIGTTTTGANLKFIVGGGSAQNIVAKMTTTGLVLNTQSSITFSDGTTQSTAAASNAYSQAAFAKANTAVQNTAVITLNSVTLTGNLIANAVGQAISVDNFLSNTATFNKNLTILGTLTANVLTGNVFFSNVTSVTSTSNSILWTTQSGLVTQQTAQLWYYANSQSLILDTDIAGDRLSISKVLFFRGFNSTGATIPANSFVRLVSGVTTNNIPYFALADATTSANATVAGFVKNAIANGAYGFAYSQGIVEDLNSTGLGQSNDILFLSTTPGVASNVAPGGANTVVQLGRIILSDATQGKIFVQNQLRQAYGRPNGQLLYAYANNIIGSNTVSVNDSTGMFTAKDITANTLTASNGIINTVRVNSTSPLTINFTTDTIVRANLSANFTLTPASFVAGKTIDVWLTNTASGGGSNKTITHGISALNSTVGGTTFTLAGTQSALLKYMCADGTLANTFVAITYQ